MKEEIDCDENKSFGGNLIMMKRELVNVGGNLMMIKEP